MKGFDIADGTNRYRPCPKCGAEFFMGLVVRKGMLAVQCLTCGHRGAEFGGEPSAEQDRMAFDAWQGEVS